MNSDKIGKVTLRDRETTDGELSRLEAYVDKEGTLVFEGYDIGKRVEDAWGDSDYEYWRRVRKEHVPRVLLELIRDRFSSDVAFHEWAKSKGIPDEFESWI